MMRNRWSVNFLPIFPLHLPFEFYSAVIDHISPLRRVSRIAPSQLFHGACFRVVVAESSVTTGGYSSRVGPYHQSLSKLTYSFIVIFHSCCVGDLRAWIQFPIINLLIGSAWCCWLPLQFSKYAQSLDHSTGRESVKNEETAIRISSSSRNTWGRRSSSARLEMSALSSSSSEAGVNRWFNASSYVKTLSISHALSPARQAQSLWMTQGVMSWVEL